MLDEVAGTKVFTGERSRAGYRLNRMAMSLTDAANRAAFVADETGYARGMGLDDVTIDLIRRRDWKAMIEAGGSIYLLIKIAGALGIALYAVGAHTSGMTLEQFMAQREGELTMGRIVGGIGSSHAPSFGPVYDKGQQKDPMWAPLFDGYEPARAWLEGLRPDLFIIVYNDHMNRFFFDAYPTFALGASEIYPQADEGWGKRDLPDMRGDPDFSWHLARSLVDDEFDPTICQEMSVDHGVMSFMPMLTDTRWPVPIVPLAVNVIQHPLPTARRLYRLGGALRRAVESYPKDLRVVVMGTGGLSHQLQGSRFGFVNQQWDNEFLDRLESDPEPLAALSHQDYMERGGTEGIEMINWLPMRSALGPKVKRVQRTYHAPMITGYGLLALEPT